jgi:hypothetical protein
LKQTANVGKLFGTSSSLANIPAGQKDFLEMKPKRETEITIETDEITIIRVSRRQTTIVFCPVCRALLRHFSVARAAAFLKISETAIFRLVEGGQVHSTETAAGALLICGNSLATRAKGMKDEE